MDSIKAARHRVAVKKYQQSEKGKAADRATSKKYCQSAKGKATNKKYRQSEKVRKYQKEYQKEYRKKHNATIRGHLYRVYNNLKRRCDNPSCKAYKGYGGRGICNNFNSFDDFRDYIIDVLGYDSYEKIKGLQIDRIDNNGDYEKGNIRFVTRVENLRNKER